MISLYQRKDGIHISLITKASISKELKIPIININMWEVETGLLLEAKDYTLEELYNCEDYQVHNMVKAIVIEQKGKVIREKVFDNPFFK